jgi:Fe-S-cluster-containing dehydrogenase component
MKITRKRFLELAAGSLLATAGSTVLAERREDCSGPSQNAKPAAARKQYGMVIDTRKCLDYPGCTKCMDACRQDHNVPCISDSAHAINWIWQAPFQDVFASQESPYIQIKRKDEPVLVLCNSCDSPPCVQVCPTGATWKRKEDGIVMMDWHRCIGCKYCIVACPYGARSFNFVDPRPYIKQLNPNFPTRHEGVVEKCIFCPERLAEGKPPACVEACPAKAIVFGDVNDPTSDVRKILGSGLTLRRRPELGTGPNIYYII